MSKGGAGLTLLGSFQPVHRNFIVSLVFKMTELGL